MHWFHEVLSFACSSQTCVTSHQKFRGQNLGFVVVSLVLLGPSHTLSLETTSGDVCVEHMGSVFVHGLFVGPIVPQLAQCLLIVHIFCLFSIMFIDIYLWYNFYVYIFIYNRKIWNISKYILYNRYIISFYIYILSLHIQYIYMIYIIYIYISYVYLYILYIFKYIYICI